ncbi:hypothetical protein GCM10011514_49490 [Emticicia aquatilis]|uniref:Endonuclease/exonuclease/phosphatase domain-containing protein n=1 Tax=Emticicia aquatilis TaxID=1537369 RepID=A0A916Z879_9BACT|nr:3-coathanger stack domain-containing protein [Emticicia aquatilis]GGD79619.1 hypothetical protein GCM10011514_49490 [Emticicia aquatilis]
MKKQLTLLLFILTFGAFGQANFSNSGGNWSFTQDFNTLITSSSATWTDNSTITGIYAQRTGTGTTIVANDGASNAGALYSYGTSTATERAIGSVGSGGAAAGNFSIGLRLTNNTGSPISSITVSYTGEQWRNSAAAAQTVAFSYITSNTAFSSVALTPSSALPTGYTAQAALDFTSPITGGTAGALNGNLAANRVAISSVINFTSPLPAGGEIILRWYDPDHTGSDHGLSIDDLTVSAGINTSPSLTVSPATINGLTYLENNGPSAGVSYSLSGLNLTPLANNITVTAPANFEVATSQNGSYADNLNVAYTGGTLFATQIFVRLKSGLAVGNYGGSGITVSNSGGGAASANVTVNGSVSNGLACGNATDIATVRATIPAQQTYTGSAGVTITGSITGIFGANKFYVQDATGGIAVFFTNVVTTNGLALGDVVRLTGTTARFNGESEIITLTCISKVSSGMVPAPTVFDSNNPLTNIALNDFLSANEGKLIKIVSANIQSTGTFVASTNYTVISCNNQGGTEIRIDATATNLIGTTIPTVTQDITGLVGRFINATGTDKLQLFPSLTTDLTNSANTCSVSGGCGLTTFTDDPNKLDVFNWNIEWLGHPTNGPSQSGTNDITQITNASNIIKDVKADVYMLQEICQYNPSNPADVTTAFGTILKALNDTYGANTFSGECSSAYSTSVADANPQRVCIIYKNSVVTKIYSKPMFENFTPATYPPTGTPSQFWASGRKPFKFLAKVNINNQTDTVLFVGLHAKSGSDLTSYNRRKYDVRAMYDTLQAEFPTRKTIVLGDLNDDVDKSIATGQISSYAPFLYTNPDETVIAGTRPSAFWNPISKTLSDANCASTASFPDYIDHQIISNEFYDNGVTGIKYSLASVSSFRPVVSNYSTTTSDHYPTVSRFEFGTACPQNLTLVDPTDSFSSGTQLKQASAVNGRIVATNMITGTANATFQAKSIELNAGFKADNGVIFKAEIGGCN